MTRPAHILIVSSGGPSRNPRPLKEAWALATAGHHVTLMYPDSGASLGAWDAAVLQEAPFRHERVIVTRGPVARALNALARRSVSWGIHSIRAVGAPGPLLRRVRAYRAELTIVHNEIPLWIGSRILAEGGQRIAADFEDWYSEDLLPADRRHRPLRTLQRFERALLQHAAYVSTTSHALADTLQARHGGRRPEVITNSFPLQRMPCFGATGAETEKPPAFFWFSQTLGPGRGLEAFVAAWARMQTVSRLVLLGEPSGDFSTTLLRMLPFERRSRVEFLPLVPPHDLPEVIAAHDVGLALEESRIVSRDLTITNKILQYLNAGLAIVATPTAGQREVLAHEREAGIFVDLADAVSTASALDSLLADRARLIERRRAARALAEARYCWESETPRLLNLVTRALAAPVP